MSNGKGSKWRKTDFKKYRENFPPNMGPKKNPAESGRIRQNPAESGRIRQNPATLTLDIPPSPR